MATNYKEQLKAIRRFTGDWFTPKHGYSASNKPNFGQRMAVLKYFNKVVELTKYATTTYKPKRGEKAEVFRTTGQTGYNKFNTGIVKSINPAAKLKISIDRSRPVGSRLVMEDTRRDHRQRYMTIGPGPILDAIEQAEEDDELASDYIQDVLEELAPGAEFYLIKSGDYYMWGSARGTGGHLDKVAARIFQLMNDYGSDKFDASDKNSSYFGNWFNGVTAFTATEDAYPLIAERSQARDKYLESSFRKIKKGSKEDRTKMRQFKDGSWHEYIDGRYNKRVYREGITQAYQDGWNSYLDGSDVEDNPYHDKQDRNDWHRGYLDAEYETLQGREIERF